MVAAKHVAERLGVSVSTVGRAMADDPRISAETKARVCRMAKELGYVGNTAARIMRGGSSKQIGLILPDVTNDFYATIAQALSECCESEGYRLVLSIHHDNSEAESKHIKELVAGRAAGAIVVPTAKPLRESVTLLSHLPHVQLLRNVHSFNPIFFGIDDESALRKAALHLLKLGHRRIAYIGGAGTYSNRVSRAEGFRAAFVDAGLDSSGATEELGPTTRAFGLETTTKLLDSKRCPTAILAGSFHITLGMLEALHGRAIAVPGQLSVIGFGDPIWFSWWGGCGLTSIHPPIQEIATNCGLWFLYGLKDIVKSAITSVSHKAISSSSFVVRGSTRRVK